VLTTGEVIFGDTGFRFVFCSTLGMSEMGEFEGDIVVWQQSFDKSLLATHGRTDQDLQRLYRKLIASWSDDEW
jgi:hypothetical protein